MVSVITVQNKPLAGEKVSFISLKTKKIYKGITDSSGQFKMLVPKGSGYDVKYRMFTTDTTYRNFNIPAGDDLLTMKYVLRVQLPQTYTLHNVFFDTGKSTLKPESYKELDELADFLHYQKTMVLEVAGYTDNVGNETDNQKLSTARAETVKNYLIKKGVPSARIQSKGYGSSNPVASNDTPGGRQQNRRTEIHTLKQ